MIKILFLSANPSDTAILRLDEEARSIDLALRQAEFRDHFAIHPHLAVRIDDLQELLLRHQPDIVHFSGHGSDEGEIILQNEQGKAVPVPANALSNLFRLFKDTVRCVVLSACYAERQAGSIAKHIDCVVGMSDEFSDDAAHNFAVAFYRGLGYGRTIQEAFDLGCSQIELAGLDEQHKPKLIVNQIDPSRVSILGGLQQQNTRNTAPTPPADFVSRPVEYNALKKLLLGDDNVPVGITGIRGAGGYGKTTLAQALCHDPAIAQHFPDGIFWVGLSQEPGELTSRVLNLVENLIDRRPGSTTLDAATSELIKALGDKKLLLVVDDVWQAAHLAPFLQGGSNCTRLITTRINTVLPLEAPRINVNAMQSNEATQLLSAGLGGGGDALKELAVRLGEWPLLLRIVNAVLRQFVSGDGSLSQSIENINQLLSEEGLGVFQNQSSTDERHISVAAALSVSLRLLSERERTLYGLLAVFPEDVDIPLATIAQLWNLSPLATKLLCVRLADLSLLLRFEHNTIRLHDVIRTYLREQQDDLVTLHNTFLGSYNLTDWTALTKDEQYLWDRLAYHLVEAGRTKELTALFADDRWLQARVAHDGYVYDGYIDDLNRSWEQVHATVLEQISAEEMPTSIALSVHYALIRTSINSLSSNYEPALIARAIETGLWSPERALSTAYKIPDAEKRSRMIIAILDTQQCNERQYVVARIVAIEAALAIEPGESRAHALAVMVPRLSGEQQVAALTQGLEAALAIQHEESRARALAVFLPHLSGEALTQGLEAALAIQHELARARALAAVVPHLSGEALTQGLEAALAIQHERARARALAVFLPHLSGEALTQGMKAALAIQHEESRADALAAMAPHLNGEALTQGLEAALAIQDERARARALAAVVPRLSGEALTQGLEAALAMQHERARARALAAVVPHLSGEQRVATLTQGLEAALAIQHEESRADALAVFLPHLNGEMRVAALTQGLEAALAIQHERARVRALAAMIPHLNGEQRVAALTQGLEAALAIQHERARARALAAVVPHLNGEQRVTALAQGLEAALAIQDERARADALAVFLPHLNGKQRVAALTQGLEAALAIQHEESRADALAVFLPYLNGELRVAALTQGLEAALAIQDERARARALAAMVPRLSGEQQVAALTQGLEAALAIQDEQSCAHALAVFLPHLSDFSYLLPKIHKATADYLWKSLRIQQRQQVLLFIADKSLFRPPVLDQDTLAAIAKSVSDICFKWRWL